MMYALARTFLEATKKRASAYQGLLIQQCQLQQKDFHLDQMVDQVVCNLYKKDVVINGQNWRRLNGLQFS